MNHYLTLNQQPSFSEQIEAINTIRRELNMWYNIRCKLRYLGLERMIPIAEEYLLELELKFESA
jgi:hypothetical protein